LPAQQYPHLVALAEEMTSRAATDEFEFGLGCLLDGVELRLEHTRAQRSHPPETTSPT
jgi:hypothetical protein